MLLPPHPARRKTSPIINGRQREVLMANEFVTIPSHETSNELLSALDWDVCQILSAFVDRGRPDQPVVRELLQGVRAPARYARDHEDRRIKVNRDSEDVIGVSGGEVDVRMDVLPFQHRALEDIRD